MKQALGKIAGLFVERVPVEPAPAQPSRPMAGRQTSPRPSVTGGGPAATMSRPPSTAAHAGAGTQHHEGAAPVPQPGTVAMQMRAIALRAWVPHEYAGLLAGYGLHVIAAGGELTADQAVQHRAQVLVVSAECLGSHTHLLQKPQLPTVFVAPQSVMIPPVAGVVQVQEPLRVSELARAVDEAIAAFRG